MMQNQRMEERISYCLIPHNRRLLRAMIIGYYVDENGLATDQFGKSLGETFPGEFLELGGPLEYYRSSELTGRRRVVDIIDCYGDFIHRASWRNSWKLISNFICNIEIPDGRRINELYMILANSYYDCCDDYDEGESEEGDNEEEDDGDGYDDDEFQSDLTGYQAEITTALWKWEKQAEKPYYLNPSFFDRVAKGTIQDYCCLNLAKLRSIATNVRCHDFLVNTTETELKQLDAMLNPNNWERYYPKKSLLRWRGSIDQMIHPMKRDENGDLVLLREDETAEYENFLISVIHNFLNPAGAKIARMLSHLEDESMGIHIDEMSDEKIETLHNLTATLESWTKCRYTGVKDPFAPRHFNFNT